MRVGAGKCLFIRILYRIILNFAENLGLILAPCTFFMYLLVIMTVVL